MFTPNAPLFRDPIYDGAADPVIVWNREEQCWFLFYTNRRASAISHGVSYVHGTKIGVASSSDQGKTWLYRGTLELEFERGTNTFWAPEIFDRDGFYHMYVSYVQGIPPTWDFSRKILHYTSKNLWDWQFESVLQLSSDRVIDACVYEIAPGTYKMWYKDENHDSHTYAAVSKDLYHWEVTGPEITDCPHEGPNVFELGGKFWMITDPWHGLGVYSSHDATCWVRQPDNILREPGSRPDDGAIGAHADVLVNAGHAYIFYFTHPEVSEEERANEDFVWEYRHRRSSLQVAELTEQNGSLSCDRNGVQMLLEHPKVN